jgi:hypothetical protein
MLVQSCKTYGRSRRLRAEEARRKAKGKQGRITGNTYRHRICYRRRYHPNRLMDLGAAIETIAPRSLRLDTKAGSSFRDCPHNGTGDAPALVELRALALSNTLDKAPHRPEARDLRIQFCLLLLRHLLPPLRSEDTGTEAVQ